MSHDQVQNQSGLKDVQMMNQSNAKGKSLNVVKTNEKPSGQKPTENQHSEDRHRKDRKHRQREQEEVKRELTPLQKVQALTDQFGLLLEETDNGEEFELIIDGLRLTKD